MKFKVSVIGAGNVGATTAQRIFEKNIRVIFSSNIISA